MANIWLGVIASLSGVIIGAIATYLSQELLWKRSTRRELYGSFVGQSNVCREQLLDVAFAIRSKLPEDELNARWEKANARMAEVSSLAAQVSMVATRGTRSAAEALEANLSDLKNELYRHNKNGTNPETGQKYRDAFNPVLRSFVAAAGRELGVARARRA
jgi:hypothetical protein